MDLTAPYVPDLDSIPAGLDLVAEIRRFKSKRKAVLLAHYYQEPEIQDLADFVGDSLQLSQQAAKADADVIAFCGVHFMAETAKILNPTKTVVIPDMDAGCSLADRCPADYFAEWLKQYPDHDVVSYINCSAGVKALSTIICTSSNAVRVVESLPKDRKLVFAPDRHLGKWVMKQTGRDMVLFPGFCIVHEQFTAKRLAALKAQHPEAKLIAHPECDATVSQLADFVGSTAALLNFVAKDSATAFIVATEAGILHQMRQRRPEAELIPAPADSGCNCSLCPYMKLNSLEKLYLCLRDLKPEILLDEPLRRRALQPLERMLALG
ncbi:MAG: quinolinate synthase NadA [Geothrix sp.]|jgi:quinolinate synthase|uniref:Quinolinate synthase n=1 Tax=Candidatus Geothrix odensensis TaxID=2954440 RepID=A0A936F0X1_9BACT|nr:quinolinate synthase NadA [Candidatus Geothrix odensensis]MCC6513195.1 quinolinate synthase NadA [Geothrix sp.]